uniref:Uncharacterized protein n=1 Tax=Sinorhizobium meliloti (strain SM11) TaxID=707241 RepID=Q1WLI8_SINMM|nr:hypothetical protein [Sinorhizobium meliloti]
MALQSSSKTSIAQRFENLFLRLPYSPRDKRRRDNVQIVKSPPPLDRISAAHSGKPH